MVAVARSALPRAVGLVFMINSTLAPPILLAHTLVAKMSMTILFRAKLTLKATPDAECAKVLSSTFYKRWHATQLNEAEYSPLFIAGLLFLSSKGIAAPICSTLACVGQIWYFWTRGLVGNSKEGGVDPPPYVPGALARYAACGMLCYELFKMAL